MIPDPPRRPVALTTDIRANTLAIAEGYEANGYSVQTCVSASKITASPDQPVVGDCRVIDRILQPVNPAWAPECYPPALTRFLGRNIRTTTLLAVLESPTKMWFKPATGVKRFDAMISDPDDYERMYMAERWDEDLPVYACDAMTFGNEWRCVSVRGEIVAWSPNPYRCRSWAPPSREVAEDIARTLWESDPARPAQSFDVALLYGFTVLVEVNPVLGLGLYGMDAGAYAKAHALAWAAVFGGTP